MNYQLWDWLFSRQRYWGELFLIIYDEAGLFIILPEETLPTGLPEVIDYSLKVMDSEDRNSDLVLPLACVADWTSVELDPGDGKEVYRHELNVIPQWVGSCWYEMCYLDLANHDCFVGKEVERYWMGPRDESDAGGMDLYVGGVGYTVPHLFYVRLWHEVLFDLGFVSSTEPLHYLFNQDYI